MGKCFLCYQSHQETNLPFINNTKGVKEVKQGTLLGPFENINFETVNAIQTPSERPPLEIHNDLLPKNDQVPTKENGRTERFTESMRQQQWNRLTREQKSRTAISHPRQS